MPPCLIHLPPEVDRRVPSENEGEDFIHVLSGRVERQIGHERLLLDAGGLPCLDSRMPHRARAIDGEATALKVNAVSRVPAGDRELQYPST